jgi:hypothetical protein
MRCFPSNLLPEVVSTLTRTGGTDFDIQTGQVSITILYASFSGWAFKFIIQNNLSHLRCSVALDFRNLQSSLKILYPKFKR